jgi:hypothetical protein
LPLGTPPLAFRSSVLLSPCCAFGFTLWLFGPFLFPGTSKFIRELLQSGISLHVCVSGGEFCLNRIKAEPAGNTGFHLVPAAFEAHRANNGGEVVPIDQHRLEMVYDTG